MAWTRLAAAVITAILGIGGAVAIWSAHDAPNWLISLSGVLALAGFIAAVFLVALAFAIIVEDVRPSVMLRNPQTPMAIAQQEASMVGRLRYRHHPIRFWGVLTLNHRFLFGFMLLNKPEYVDLLEDRP